MYTVSFLLLFVFDCISFILYTCGICCTLVRHFLHNIIFTYIKFCTSHCTVLLL